MKADNPLIMLSKLFGIILIMNTSQNVPTLYRKMRNILSRFEELANFISFIPVVNLKMQSKIFIENSCPIALLIRKYPHDF